MLAEALLVTNLSTAHVWPPVTPDDGSSPVGVSADTRLVADAAVLADGCHAHAGLDGVVPDEVLQCVPVRIPKESQLGSNFSVSIEVSS